MLKDQNKPEWKVLLIGGSTAVGKTVVAKALSQYFQVSLLLVDDLRLALQQITTPDQQPALHTFLTNPPTAQYSAEQICEDWITVGKSISPAIKTVMGHHIVVAGAGPIIIEGDGILPEFAAQSDFRELKFFWGLQTTHEIRSIFLDEPDENRMMKNMQSRGRGFNELPLDEQQTWARASWLYSQWLCHEARTHNIPVLAARPYETLFDRILIELKYGLDQ